MKLFETLHYTEIKVGNNGVISAVNPLKEFRRFIIAPTQNENHYCILLEDHEYYEKKHLDNLTPFQVNLTFGNDVVSFCDYYFKMTDQQKQELKKAFA